MQAAAAVDLADDNNAEILTTVQTCASAAEWLAAIARYPDVEGTTKPSADQDLDFLDTVCVNQETENGRVCVDARRLGLIYSKG